MVKNVVDLIKKHKVKSIVTVIFLTAYYFCLPKQLFNDPTSTVIYSEEGELLGAKIAEDEQWRFPKNDSIPEKFKQCIIYFEDEYFYSHPGFNPVSMMKAIKQNWEAGKVVRGGSTLTQQVIRLSRKGKKRSYFEKFIELILATRLEIRSSKEEILNLYASNAPFGGNVVGLDVAAWRYFGVLPHQLSWAESATLAVLPNAPSLIYPGKNQEQLLEKRNRLLKKLLVEGILDQLTYELSIAESLPQKPFLLPQHAPHLIERMAKVKKGERITSSIDFSLQQNINNIVARHHAILEQNQIHNTAVLVIDIATRKVRSYVGNTPTTKSNQKDVDIITAARSTGSVLKPFLYAALLDGGELLPETLVADVPTYIGGYHPKNYSERYDGAVPAKRALARSLNVPAVRLLQSYNLEKFRDQLNYFDLRDIDKPADHYGLSLILGGAESNLWDLCKSYANLASTLNHFNETSSEYYAKEFQEPILLKEEVVDFGNKTSEKSLFDAGSIYLTFEAMKEVNRPEGNEAWEFYDSSKEIAWKTGTSFGNRDAWAIGVTKQYVVGVWVGNADGEGRPGLTGLSGAAPVLFDVFDVLPQSSWFERPFDELTEAEVCDNSGFLASPICPKKSRWIPVSSTRTSPCPYHRWVHLDTQKQYRVHAQCQDPSTIESEAWFVLPPLMAHYYKSNNAEYRPLPPYRNDCKNTIGTPMEFIFPKANAKVFLPKNLEGETNELVLKIAHSKPETTIFWYVDDVFIGSTETFHEMAIRPATGKHLITVVDSLGNELVQWVEIEK
ncbi:penicillin-binding protein 1C [Sungkyunkwania multivorans]|uniref:peptidoglycan glycosyltransferase n=1 Tax=Sungkyunkwania multivorans TaxID=1173618 RepID=A0ABW3D2T0_9FLAO